jgi:DNA-binding transcriptional LysR family regulator
VTIRQKLAVPAEMSAFVRTAALGGFSIAARDLSLTPSAVSKLVTRLEARLGVRLLNRTTRKLSLTPEGTVYFERAKRIVAAIEETENEIAGLRKRPKGPLRVSVLVSFGRSQLLPALPRFLERNPEIQLDVELTDRRIDLVEAGVDLAIRLGELEDSSLVARKICDVERLICASPAYLARRGTPRLPEDLLQHNCLWISSFPALKRWPFTTDRGTKTVAVSGNLAAGDAEALLELACQGLGIIRVADYLVGPEIAKGRLVPILADVHDGKPIPLQAVHAYGRQRSPKVAAMVEFLLESFGGAPWRRR